MPDDGRERRRPNHAKGIGSDRGTCQRHQRVADGTFVLIEYREKTQCDGKSMKPAEFPLVYRRQVRAYRAGTGSIPVPENDLDE